MNPLSWNSSEPAKGLRMLQKSSFRPESCDWSWSGHVERNSNEMFSVISWHLCQNFIPLHDYFSHSFSSMDRLVIPNVVIQMLADDMFI